LANRTAALLLSVLLAVPAGAELLKLSLLKKSAPPFSLKRDIFNGNFSANNDQHPGGQATMPPAQAAELQKTIAEEIFASVSYEGFVIKGGKKSVLLNVSGEFFMVSEGEQIQQKIKVLKIGRDLVTIEYENQPYDIKIKGDENG
jgi:hypothetical protein